MSAPFVAIATAACYLVAIAPVVFATCLATVVLMPCHATLVCPVLVAVVLRLCRFATPSRVLAGLVMTPLVTPPPMFVGPVPVMAVVSLVMRFMAVMRFVPMVAFMSRALTVMGVMFVTTIVMCPVPMMRPMMFVATIVMCPVPVVRLMMLMATVMVCPVPMMRTMFAIVVMVRLAALALLRVRPMNAPRIVSSMALVVRRRSLVRGMRPSPLVMWRRLRRSFAMPIGAASSFGRRRAMVRSSTAIGLFAARSSLFTRCAPGSLSAR